MGNFHVIFFPFMASGHMIPIRDMAILFSSRGLQTTIITTPLNAPIFSKSVETSQKSGNQIALHIVRFPAAEAGLPEGCENHEYLPSNDMIPCFIKAISMIQEPVERFIQESRPNCIVADMLFPWATDVAARLGIPRIVFHGTSFFAQCASETMMLHQPFLNVSSDSETFLLPGLPHDIKLTRKQIPRFDVGFLTDFAKLIIQSAEAELKSYGVIFNSFYELEPDYVRHHRQVLKRKSWHIGPVSLCNKDLKDKFERGKKAAIDEHECLKWLDTKKPNSVVYVCFGTLAKVTPSQLIEIAMGLEACDQDFIWAIRKGEEDEEWMPEGFEERTKMKGKGLVIKGWAPQVLILDHEAVGGFVTHCGWNSVLEGVCGGVAMVTWPVMAEQFFNEKLVTEVLRVGVSIGNVEWSPDSTCEGVKREAIANAVKRLMVGEEGEEMRKRAMELKEMAIGAVEEGGSSYSDLNAFIEEMAAYGS